MEVLGFGDQPLAATDGAVPVADTGRHKDKGNYDAAYPVQLLGNGDTFDPGQMSRLTDDERQRLLHKPKGD